MGNRLELRLRLNGLGAEIVALKTTSNYIRTLLLAVVLAISLTPVRAAAKLPPLAKKLVSAAQMSIVEGQTSLAITLLRGAWEIVHDPEVLRQLAEANSMAGQHAEAIESYKRLLKHSPSSDVARAAKAEISRLEQAPAPFEDRLARHRPARAQARAAFAKGVKLHRRKKLGQAIRYLRAALVLAPELPGPYRYLGGIYGQLKDSARERAFLMDYLRIRPDGRIADIVRKRLKPTGELASVDLRSSFPCQIWVNGRRMNKQTPLQGLLLPPGNYTVSFVNGDYHVVKNKRIRLSAGQEVSYEFPFGILVLKLKPWATPRANGRYIGLWDKIGLPVGEYELSLVAHDDSQRKRMTISVQAGETVTVRKW
jgi:tetratricopeptide (TPR) repeat protein